MLRETIGVPMDESQQDEWKAQCSQRNMRNQNEVIHLPDPTLAAKGRLKSRKVVTNVRNQEQ